MKKFLFTLALVGACIFTASSQDYKSAIGLRLGSPNSISYKHFLSQNNAIEVFLGYRRQSAFINFLNVGVLYQVHNRINGAEGLRWYYGGGATVFFWNYDRDVYASDLYNNLNIGIMGNLGLDYKFVDLPLNLSLDWTPTFVIGDAYYDKFRGDYYALSARYTF